MTQTEQNEALKAIIEAVTPRMFSVGYLATNPDKDELAARVIGTMISQYFQYDADAIVDVAVNALEDANFDRFGIVLRKSWEDFASDNFAPDEEETE